MWSLCRPKTIWLTVFLASVEFLLSEGQQTFYCEQDETVSLNMTSQTATIITRLSGTSVYDDNLNCKWKITTTPTGDVDRRIHVKVISSDLDYAPDDSNCNTYDYVAVKEEYMSDSQEVYYDWNDADIGHYFTWCGNANPHYFSSRDGVLVIEFQTNDRNTYKKTGVQLEVSTFEVGSCPPEWSAESSRSTNHCYKLRTHDETWADAQDYCHKEQANLVSFADNTEADFVTEMVQSAEGLTRDENVWIGLSDIAVNDEYVWIDGISSSVTYRWQSSNHKADEYDNCVSVGHSHGQWQEEYCTESDIRTTTKNKFVCKTNKDVPPTLYLVPEDRQEREGEGTSLPIHYIIVGALIVLGLIVAAAALLVYACKRQRTTTNTRQGGNAYVSTGTRSDRAKAVADESPPSYQEAVDGTTILHNISYDSDEPEIEEENKNFKPIVITCAAILLVVIIVLAVLLCAIFKRKPSRNKRRNRRQQQERPYSDTELHLNPVVPTPQARSQQPRHSEGMILLGEQDISRQPSATQQTAMAAAAPHRNIRHSPPPTYHEAVNM